MPNPSKPPVVQWLRLVTLIAAVKVGAERDSSFFFVSCVIFHCNFFAPKFKFEFQKGYTISKPIPTRL